MSLSEKQIKKMTKKQIAEYYEKNGKNVTLTNCTLSTSAFDADTTEALVNLTEAMKNVSEVLAGKNGITVTGIKL